MQPKRAQVVPLRASFLFIEAVMAAVERDRKARMKRHVIAFPDDPFDDDQKQLHPDQVSVIMLTVRGKLSIGSNSLKRINRTRR